MVSCNLLSGMNDSKEKEGISAPVDWRVKFEDGCLQSATNSGDTNVKDE